MRYVYKFQMDFPAILHENHTFKMSLDTKIVHVAMQHGHICLWGIVDTNKLQIERRFIVLGTGHPLLNDLTYVGTVLDGQFAWHVFEVTP